MRDRFNQLTLGIFVATFVYAMVVLRSIRSSDDQIEEFVPQLGVNLAFVFVLASVVVFLLYIHHIAQSIRVATIIDLIATDTRAYLERRYPREDDEGSATGHRAPDGLVGPSRIVAAARPGVIVSIDDARLAQLAERSGATMYLLRAIGEFVPAGAALLRVFGEDTPSDNLLRAGIVLGEERTADRVALPVSADQRPAQQERCAGRCQRAEQPVVLRGPQLQAPGVPRGCRSGRGHRSHQPVWMMPPRSLGPHPVQRGAAQGPTTIRRSGCCDRVRLNRRVAVEVLEFLVDQVKVEVFLVARHLEYLDSATHPHLISWRQACGHVRSDDEDGILSDLVTAKGQRVWCDDRGDLTDQLDLLPHPPLQAFLGRASLTLFTYPRLLYRPRGRSDHFRIIGSAGGQRKGRSQGDHTGSAAQLH